MEYQDGATATSIIPSSALSETISVAVGLSALLLLVFCISF